MMPRRSRARVGVAIARDHLVVAVRGGAGDVRTWSHALDVPGADEAADRWEAWVGTAAGVLRDALDEMGIAPGSLHVALLPPLVECRLIDMPGLRDGEVARVLSRDAARHFATRTGPLVVAATPSRGPRAMRGRGLLAAAAPVRLVEGIHQAAARAGCTVDGIVPAAAAWAAAAGDARILAVVADGRADVLRIERGHIVALRRAPLALLDAPRLLELVRKTHGDGAASPDGVAIAGDAPLVTSLAELLAAAGTPPARLGLDADALAAAFASDAAGPALVPAPLRAARERRERRLTAGMLVAAAALLLAAGAVEMLGARRELARVAAERAAIRTRLTSVLATRDTLTLLGERLAALREVESGAPRWSAAAATVAAWLPRDAHLLSLRAEADSLVLDGLAVRAAPVLEALGRAPGVVSVRAQGSIRQEVREDTGPVERLTLVAHLARTSRAPSGGVPGGAP